MNAYKLTYKLFGDCAVLIEWPSKIDENIIKDVLLFKNKILKNNIISIVEMISSYSSLTICYTKNITEEISVLETIYTSTFSLPLVENYRWKIPVCYDEKFGIDLHELSQKKELETEAIIKLHFTPIYTIFFIGFLPGFLYLGGLDSRLNFDRKSNPRLSVKKGSVGIAGPQTGIYPSESSGGWNIIGNSPIPFFNPKNEEPCFAKAGDEIQFYNINLKEYQQIKIQVEIGCYILEKNNING